MRQITILAILALSIGCSGNTNTQPDCESYGDTPTAAYKRLFEAVKSKNTDSIKATMTGTSIEFASGVAAKNNQSLEKVFENGFTGTTFSPNLPEIRDERVSCNMGAVEVWNARSQVWDDLPFIIEEGKWKLAIGDLFKGSFKSPGKGLSTKEAEAANAARGNVMPTSSNSSTNSNRIIGVKIPANSTINSNSLNVK